MQSGLGPAAVARILDDLRRIVRVLRESSRASERALGVTGAQLFALKTIAQSPGVSLSELANRTRTHQSTVSVVVKRLIAARLVSRVTSTSDGRRVELAATAKGRALLAKAPLAAQERLIEGIEQLPRKHGELLATSLHRLVVAMQLDEEAPVMFFEDDTVPASRGSRRRARVPERSRRA
ncbi:MAG: hypothetical protein BGO98_15180 [Myxococcales bacterium 68-20]|nr:MAG: hypothetical protein BGO98_15180 [Myxococcales bacterium 68-20]